MTKPIDKTNKIQKQEAESHEDHETSTCNNISVNNVVKNSSNNGQVGIKYSDFKIVDREAEDLLIKRYQKTKDEKMLEGLYRLREQTLGICARRYSYLAPSYDDLLGDLKLVWLKCVNQYEYGEKTRNVKTNKGHLIFNSNGVVKTVRKRTPFNTFLYTSIRNHMSNLFKRKHMKKKTNMAGDVVEDNMVSIDKECSFNNSHGDQSATLHNFLTDDKSDSSSSAATQTLVKDIAMGDDDVRKVLDRYASDPHIKTISSACDHQYVYGSVKVSNDDLEFFKHNDVEGSKKRLKKIIDSSGQYPKGFKVSSFRLCHKSKNNPKKCDNKDTEKNNVASLVAPESYVNVTKITNLPSNASRYFGQKYAIPRSPINPYRVNSVYGLIFDILYAHKQSGIKHVDVVNMVSCLTRKTTKQCKYNVETVTSIKKNKNSHNSVRHAMSVYWIEKKYINGCFWLKLHLHKIDQECENQEQEVYFELHRKDGYVLHKTRRALEKYKQKNGWIADGENCYSQLV
jgi:hypothetical protein